MNKSILSSEEILQLQEQDKQFKEVTAQNLITMRHLLKKLEPEYWGQERMAEFFGVSTSTYKRWEKHGVDSLTASWMVRYKKLFFICRPEYEKKAGNEMVCEFMSLFENAMSLLKLPSKSVARQKD